MTFDASGANASALHSKVIVLSMTAVVQGGEVPVAPLGLVFVPNPLVHDAAVSAFVDRPTAQSSSCPIATLKWWMKPPVEMPTAFPHGVWLDDPLPPLPAGPFHCDALLGEPGLFQLPQVIEVLPSCARRWPFDDTCPSNAADAKRWT